jgi:ABC-type sugar transport system substrate-binding protein
MWTRIASAATAAVLAIGAAGLAACGSDSGGSSGTSSAPASDSASAGTAPAIKVKKQTIGVVNLVRQSPAEDKIDQLYEKAGTALGWDVKIVDGAGDPQKIATAAQNFVNQGVAALITTSTDAAAVRQALTAAKRKGIPTISTNGGTADSPLFTAKYEEDEVKMGTQLAEYIKSKHPDAKIGDLKTNLAISGVQRETAFTTVFPKSAFAASQNVDLSNPVVNTQKTLSDMLTAHPDINAVHAVFDNMAQAAITTIRSKKSDAKLYTYFTTANNVKNLRANTALEGLSDVNLPKTGAVALDQLVSHFQKNTPVDPDALSKDPLTYNVVDRSNMDQLLGNRSEQYSVDAILAPYLKKWAQEYPGT